MKLKVEGHPDMVRDSHSKAIVMQDADSFKAYQAEKEFRVNLSKASASSQSDINSIKEEMSEIKALLVSLFSKIDQKKVN